MKSGDTLIGSLTLIDDTRSRVLPSLSAMKIVPFSRIAGRVPLKYLTELRYYIACAEIVNKMTYLYHI